MRKRMEYVNHGSGQKETKYLTKVIWVGTAWKYMKRKEKTKNSEDGTNIQTDKDTRS